MNTTPTARTIRATIVPEAISRVPSFYDAGLGDICNELLQNARRAGAAKVDVTVKDGIINVADDGIGIAEPQDILAFGGSGWTNRRVMNERPAGMGFYALARRNLVTVRSNPRHAPAWQVSLEPEHFSGQKEAKVVPIDQSEWTDNGTVVTFDWKPDCALHIIEAARHFPLPVSLNGEPVEQSDFLADCREITEWQGLRIGVHVNTTNLNYWGCDRRRINFHGIIINGANHLPTVPTINPRAEYIAKVDVGNCRHLEMTLPARKELVQTPFIDQMREACLEAIYQAIAASTEPVNVPRAVQQDAAKMGIRIADAARRLKPWRPNTEWRDSAISSAPLADVPADAALMSLRVDQNVEHTVYRALELAGMTERFFEPDDANLKGYDWYDQLPRANAVAMRAIFGDQTAPVKTEFNYDASDEYREQMPGNRPDAIEVMLQAANPNGEASAISLNTDVAMIDEDCTFLDDVAPLVTSSCQLSSHDLAKMMMDAYFTVSDDKESDSYHTQEHWAWESAQSSAISILESYQDAMARTVQAALLRCDVNYQLPAGSRITVLVGPKRQLDVTIDQPAGPNPEANAVPPHTGDSPRITM